MALVGYSDSEGSDTEAPPAPKVSAPSRTVKATTEKLVDPSAPRKIKVDLPAVAPTTSKPEERPVKRARTGGNFSGFNALLPAPKRTADSAKKTGLGSGVSLKTSSAAAFSREPVDTIAPTPVEDVADREDAGKETGKAQKPAEDQPKPAEEVKIVGNAMRFRPLSVANKKKPKKPIPASATPVPPAGPATLSQTTAPAPPPKVSLFSVAPVAAPAAQHTTSSTYEPLIAQDEPNAQDDEAISSTIPAAAPAPHDPNSLSAVASDLNLSAADRRRLFGRDGRAGQAINIANFDMDREYRANEVLRAQGEATQHRAVRAVAPGKHSLQQLVNAATNQREALEDAWAEGKRNRGEAGNKYGWGK